MLKNKNSILIIKIVLKLLLVIGLVCFFFTTKAHAEDNWTLPIANADYLSAGYFDPRPKSKIIEWHPIFKKFMNVHGGLDIPCVQGTPVYSTVPGKIIEIGNDPLKIIFDKNGKIVGYKEGFGNFIRWKDNEENIHRIAHLYKPVVIEGTDISAGQFIAESGWTGLATERGHVHYDVTNKYGRRIYVTKNFGITWRIKK